MKICFRLSVIASFLFSLMGLKLSFQSPYTIQDDARQHIFWMQQFQDGSLFPDDLITDYFKSVAPWGFSNLYYLVNNLGIDIFLFNKISPLLITLVATIYCFLVCLEIFPIPFAAFISSLLLNQNLWMVDDVSSGTPRAFIYPLFLGFIYYLLRPNFYLCLFFILLQGLFYPQTVLISATLILLRLCWKKSSYSLLDKQRKLDLLILLTSVMVLGIYALTSSEFEPVITMEEAKLLPEFNSQGRSDFFSDNLFEFWLFGRRSGILPIEWQYSLVGCLGLNLLWFKKYPRKYQLVDKLNKNWVILLQIFIASIILFCLSHLLLFKLHLPGRYTHHTFRIILALLDGIAIAVLFHNIISWFNSLFFHYKKTLQFLATVFLICLLLLPTYAVQAYPHRLGYVTGKSPELYKFLQHQSNNYLIATLSQEGDFIPSFAGRKVLVAEEYAIPYHQGYYQQIRQRVQDLITAQYTLNKKTLVDFINKYHIDLWLIDGDAKNVSYLQNNPWLMQFTPEITQALSTIKTNQEPILLTMTHSCSLLEQEKYILLKTTCILNKL